ncbi:hypothetical protein AKJ09_04516 [Labilithrix luteola]|uniref:Uncharacterized protein n=1 Tax=Labilithrix luteola TaxID=1391654 RepID=A0A0K1PWF6_9BACT|nr:hypothetical protein [Labilithrix luteola]AKU97852.1 hypothetical protein AKJ09_04516 [Labilithrix luteola]
MSNVSGVGNRRDYTNEELEALHKDQASGVIMNKARHDAGFKETDVSMRGDDPSLNETLHHGHINGGEVLGGVVHGLEVGHAVGAIHFPKFMACAPEIALPIVAGLAAQGALYSIEKRKDEVKGAATRDQMHAAMLDNLELPTGYANQAIDKLGVSFTNGSPADRISKQLQTTDKGLRATLQLHCDQGMHAARDMSASGMSKEAFLKANPAVAERYGSDMAFREGFDGMEWAKQQGPAVYDKAVSALMSRDARNDAAHVSYRV